MSKGTRKYIRQLKSEVRREMGITRPQVDSVEKEKLNIFLQLKLGSQYEKYAHHFPTLWEFCQIRETIRKEGFRKELIDDFQAKHGRELLSELSPALSIILEYVGKNK